MNRYPEAHRQISMELAASHKRENSIPLPILASPCKEQTHTQNPIQIIDVNNYMQKQLFIHVIIAPARILFMDIFT